MENSFRPQWRPWNFQLRQNPKCGRCGFLHRDQFCTLLTESVILVDILDISLECAFHLQGQQNSFQVNKTKMKSQKQKTRDFERMRRHLQKKNSLRELPFANVRNTSFLNSLDTSSSLKEELKSAKRKLSSKDMDHKKEILELKSKCDSLKTENDSLRSQLNDVKRELQSKPSQSIVNVEQYVEQIKNLEQQLKNKDIHISAISEKFRLQCVEFDAVAVEASKKSFILKNQNEADEEWINSLKNQVKELTS